jgi:hypothetical protein
MLREFKVLINANQLTFFVNSDFLIEKKLKA